MASTGLFLIVLIAIGSGIVSVYARPDKRIINGEDAKPGDIPYQVSLQTRLRSAHFCGGALLNENYVITAAHCVKFKLAITIKIAAGSVYLHKPHIQRNVANIIVHKDFSVLDSLNNDIALLKLESPITPTEYISFVPLPSPSDVINPSDVAVVSGWGAMWEDGVGPLHLQKVNIFIADQKYCKDMYQQMGYNIYPTHICAYDPSEMRGSCNGDSGGPLTVNGKLVGLVSWAKACALTDYPTVYTRVASHLDWIQKNAVSIN